MEELQVIETTSGRQFKPWVDADKLQQIVSDPASITGITSEIASGKQAIAQAINAKGGSASATETFQELADKIGDITYTAYIGATFKFTGDFFPQNIDEFLRNKDLVDEINIYMPIVDNYTLNNFKNCRKVTISGMANVNLQAICLNESLQEINIPDGETFTQTSGTFANPFFAQYKNAVLNMPNLYNWNIAFFNYSGNRENFRSIILGKLTTFAWIGNNINYNAQDRLRNMTVGKNTSINLDFSYFWRADSVIAEGQSGIDDLNSNIQNNLIGNLYDFSGGTAHSIKLHANVKAILTQETIDMANAKGWNIL